MVLKDFQFIVRENKLWYGLLLVLISTSNFERIFRTPHHILKMPWYLNYIEIAAKMCFLYLFFILRHTCARGNVWIKLQIYTSWFTWQFFLRFPILSIYGTARHSKKSIHGNNSFLLFSLYHVEKWKKCDRRKVRKWHATIYFYIKRIFICLNRLFPAFCFLQHCSF